MRSLINQIAELQPIDIYGTVRAVRGLAIEVTGPPQLMQIGARLKIEISDRRHIYAEVVGFRDDLIICLPFADLAGVQGGCKAWLVAERGYVFPSSQWLGRVVDALGNPIDGAGPMPRGAAQVAIQQSPLPAHQRTRVGAPINLGVRALNTFATCCLGQRMGIFAGSGVGKSVLLSMLARNTACDVAVIGLIGERGREVQEFIEENLGEEGLKRTVLVVATSDESALRRREAAYLTLALAEFFRDQGNHVLCMMDSVTRFAMAQREIGLAVGEPPATKGFTPTVFAELPRLLERAGPGRTADGSITGLFTVLVEGDNTNEPISDAVRGILDGHIVMSRDIAERGRFPAIDVLRSVSRTMPGCVPEEVQPLLAEARRAMSIYADMEELIRMGAYRSGSNAETDWAIQLNSEFERFLSQSPSQSATLEEGYSLLGAILGTAANSSAPVDE